MVANVNMELKLFSGFFPFWQPTQDWCFIQILLISRIAAKFLYGERREEGDLRAPGTENESCGFCLPFPSHLMNQQSSLHSLIIIFHFGISINSNSQESRAIVIQYIQKLN